MTSTTTATTFEQVLDHRNRADPWDLYTRLRENPVQQEPDGTWVISTHAEVGALLRDPRVSVDPGHANRPGRWNDPARTKGSGTFLELDNPDHDRLRSVIMRQFGPPERAGLVESMRANVEDLVTDRVDALMGRPEFDLVESVSHPIPVEVICRLMGIPGEDALHLGELAEQTSFNPRFLAGDYDRDLAETAVRAQHAFGAYFGAAVASSDAPDADHLMARLKRDRAAGAPITAQDLTATFSMLFIGGHETTLNLITNTMLTLLRHPESLAAVRADPELAATAIEETLRYEPSVHMRPRTTVADIEMGGRTIPAGSSLVLLIAAANRDPAVFADPDHYDIRRTPNPHLSFGGAVHFCFGAPLGRLEATTAVRELTRRLVNPRLVEQPPYRLPADLRGPAALRIAVDGVRPAASP